MTNEEISIRVARLEERMSDLEGRLQRQSMLLKDISDRQFYVLLGIIANLAGMAGTFVAVMLKT